MRDPDDISWARLKRALYVLCIREHGPALVERLCALSELCAPEQQDAAVAAWVGEVLRDVETRLRMLGSTGDGLQAMTRSPLAGAISLFAEPRRLSDKLRGCRHRVCRAIAAGLLSDAERVLWTAMKQHFHDARSALTPSSARLRNWDKIAREIRSIRSERHRASGAADGPDRMHGEWQAQDCSWLAVELLARSRDPARPFALDDVSTLDGVLEYLWRYMPECWVEDADLAELDLEPQPASVMEVLALCLDRVELRPSQRRAITDAFLSETEPPMTASERKGHLKALRAGLSKLKPCIRRYIDGGALDTGSEP